MEAATLAKPASTDFRRLTTLAAGAIGVVYGDIGTSPLYALQECFGEHNGLGVTRDNVFGIASLVLWALIIVVAVKYVLFVMRADNRGEGGILALLALVGQTGRKGPIMIMGLFGSALFFGDGVVTPAISVLSAVEGLMVVTPALEQLVIPLTLTILVALFLIQKRGTAQLGRLFAPVMGVWFIVIAVLGISQIVQAPEILAAFSPHYGAKFLIRHGWQAFVVLGSVVLAVTGGEALYADMGHFGKRPIQISWFTVVLPALVLNYVGQAALLLSDPSAARSPFYLLAPSWALIPLVILATLATVIASQAVISGVFSLSRQAVQLGFSPRIEILHTNDEEEGQIYVPRANWLLLVGIILLVLGFRSSSNLAGAYGIAVTGTMAVTTILALVVAHRSWGWKKETCILLGILFLTVDCAFFGANLLKVPNGGWFSLAVGLGMFLLMQTWKQGRQLLTKRLSEDSVTLDDFLKQQKKTPAVKIPGTAVFMTSSGEKVPLSLLLNIRHNKVIHERIVFCTVVTEPVPRVPAKDRLIIEGLADGIYRMSVHYGFVQEPDIPRVLRFARAFGMDFDLMQTSFFLGRETLISGVNPELPFWQTQMFMMMSRNAISATDFLKIPPGRVVEFGTQVQL